MSSYFALGLVEFLPDGVGIADVLAAGKGDQGSLGQMRAGLFILAGADEVGGASMAAEVNAPVRLVCEPWRGRHASPVSTR